MRATSGLPLLEAYIGDLLPRFDTGNVHIIEGYLFGGPYIIRGNFTHMGGFTVY